MSQLKELLDREADRVGASPDALDVTLKAFERRQRDRRVGTAVFALAVFGFLAVALVVALGHRGPNLGSPAAQAGNGAITVSEGGTGPVVSVDPTTGKVVSSSLFALPTQGSLGDWSPNGRYLAYRDGGTWRIYDATTDRSLGILLAPADRLRWSPDSTSIAFQSQDAVWRLDIATDTRTKVGPCNSQDGIIQAPLCGVAWSGDGTRLAIVRASSIDLVRADGSGGSVLIPRLPGPVIGDPSWSTDNGAVSFIASRGRSSSGLFTVNSDGTGLHKLADIPGRFLEAAPAWSPDGSRVAVLAQGNGPASSRGHELDAIVLTLAGTSPPVVVPTGNCYCLGFAPGIEWSPDSAELALVIPGPGSDKPVAGLYVMHADGTDLRLLRSGAWGHPAWSPVRPSSAT